MHARSYSPSLGRFLQPDPARADANLYEYAGNGPVTAVDPAGLWPWDNFTHAGPYERWYCLLHPLECLVNNRVTGYAFEVGRAAGGNAADPMRHCVWQCLLANMLGLREANTWGWLHELDNLASAGDRQTEALRTIVDIHNNAVGRSLARFLPVHYYYNKGTRRLEMPHIEYTDAVRLCRTALYGGVLWMVRHGHVERYAGGK
jgi:hypothetical protein